MRYSDTDKLAAIERELAYRRRVYPRLIADRKMTQALADKQISMFEAIAADYTIPRRQGGAPVTGTCHPQEEKTCPRCDTVFIRQRGISHKDFAKRIFCSRSCSTEVRHQLPVLARFEANYIPEPNSGCWLWIGTDMGEGYGVMMVGGKRVRANRLSFEMHKGPLPKGKGALHTCDNPPCVNPDHLYAGTAKENAHDRWSRSYRGSR